MSLYSKWAKKEHPESKRIGFTLLAGVVFVYLLPLAVARGGASLDQRLGLSPFNLGMLNSMLGGVLIVAGFSLGIWSGYVQISQGRGTPLPLLPTQTLLREGPYRYCRNPMTLGTILAYLGIGLYAGTLTGMGLVVLFALLLMLYLKLLEEKELAERFGAAYLAYKREVPFLIPRLPRQR